MRAPRGQDKFLSATNRRGLNIPVLLGCIRAERDKAKVTWEYKVVPASELRPDYNYGEYLNKLGAQGWELVAVTDSNNTANTVMYLKRAK